MADVGPVPAAPAVLQVDDLVAGRLEVADRVAVVGEGDADLLGSRGGGGEGGGRHRGGEEEGEGVLHGARHAPARLNRR